MNILYIGYWNASDPLTRATIYPHLKILQEFDFVSQIVFVNTERASPHPDFTPAFPVSKITYHPLFSKNYPFVIVNKLMDFLRFPKQIKQIIQQHGIDLVIARGAPAGALAYLACRSSNTPFLVESFEPHADYMLEGEVWNKLDPRYIFQKKWERKQKKYARGLMPVADNYRKRLLSEGLTHERVMTVPCAVDPEVFAFNQTRRAAMRKQFNLNDDAIVGIYVGKFGGLYLAEEVFKLYAEAFRFFKEFFLIILAPAYFHHWINVQIKRHGLPLSCIHVNFVGNEQVPDYLSMSDFAYATYKPGLFKAYLSPVKVGEFWCSGLPVVLTRGVGDESEFIEKRTAGVLFDPDDINREVIDALYLRLNTILGEPGLRVRISELARVFRNPDHVVRAYKHFLIGRL